MNGLTVFDCIAGIVIGFLLGVIYIALSTLRQEVLSPRACAEELSRLLATKEGEGGFWVFILGDYPGDMRAGVRADGESVVISLRNPPGTRSSMEYWDVVIHKVTGELIGYDALEERILWKSPGSWTMTRVLRLEEGQYSYEFSIRELLRALRETKKFWYEPAAS